jgi:hypothetical protein
LSHLPDCIQEAWRTRAPTNPLYKDVLAPITGAGTPHSPSQNGQKQSPWTLRDYSRDASASP